MVNELVAHDAAVVERRRPGELATLEMSLDRARPRREALAGEEANVVIAYRATACGARLERNAPQPAPDELDELQALVTRCAAVLFNEVDALPRRLVRREPRNEVVQLVELDRLDEMCVETRFRGAGAILILPIARQREEARAPPRDLTHASRKLVAVHHGQAEIEHADLGLEAGLDTERLRAVVGDLHFVTKGIERFGEGLGRIDIVVDHQDAARAERRPRVRLLRSMGVPQREVQHRQADHELAASPRPFAVRSD